jgi:hypothetical protein
MIKHCVVRKVERAHSSGTSHMTFWRTDWMRRMRVSVTTTAVSS